MIFTKVLGIVLCLTVGFALSVGAYLGLVDIAQLVFTSGTQ